MKRQPQILKHNVGRTDQIIRIAAGILVIALGLFLGSWWGLIGLIPLLTGMARWCPVYGLLHINTLAARPGARLQGS